MQSPEFEDYGDAWVGAQNRAATFHLPGDDETVAIVALGGEWRGSGAADRPFGRALFESATVEFGLRPSPLPMPEGELQRLTAVVLERHGGFLRRCLRFQYQRTEELLAEVPYALFRGLRDARPSPGVRDPQLRALTSYAYDLAVARDFDHPNLIHVAQVPRQRILATPVTGFASFDERELVVLGPTGVDDRVRTILPKDA